MNTARTRVKVIAQRSAFGVISMQWVCVSGGCYERVINARGIGADRYNVQSGYRSNTAADRAVDDFFAPRSSVLSSKSRWSQETFNTPNALGKGPSTPTTTELPSFNSGIPRGATFRPGFTPSRNPVSETPRKLPPPPVPSAAPESPGQSAEPK